MIQDNNNTRLHQTPIILVKYIRCLSSLFGVGCNNFISFDVIKDKSKFQFIVFRFLHVVNASPTCSLYSCSVKFLIFFYTFAHLKRRLNDEKNEAKNAKNAKKWLVIRLETDMKFNKLICMSILF